MPFKGINKVIRIFVLFLKRVVPNIFEFLRFPRVLEGLESSGRLVGFVSTYPGTSPTPWFRVMTKKTFGGGECFLPSTVSGHWIATGRVLCKFLQ